MRRLIRAATACVAVSCGLVASLRAQDEIVVRVVEPGPKVAVAARATTERLVLDLVVDSGWHLYARDVGGGQPVEIEIAEGSSFAAVGPLEIRPPAPDGHIIGKARLTLPLRRVAEGDVLNATFRYMVCDPLMCLPPQEVRITSERGGSASAPLSVLLVVTEEGDRSARIARFLAARGVRVDVTTYEAVQRERCDAHDVVVADSPYFSACRGMVGHARAFPRTGTPIVAVGFLGTELVEAHGLAMTSGYI